MDVGRDNGRVKEGPHPGGNIEVAGHIFSGEFPTAPGLQLKA